MVLCRTNKHGGNRKPQGTDCPLTFTQGSSITLADGSDGCQLVRAEASFWRMGPYNGSKRCPIVEIKKMILTLLYPQISMG